MLHIYNTLTRAKQIFVPLEAGKVRMYVCGMTVYDYCHVGHARVMVVFDIVARYLRYRGYEVIYVRNITDIDDKIIQRAAENGESIQALSGRFIAAMHADADALGVLRPSLEPRATESLELITHMIATLIDKGFAYQAPHGDIYYAVNQFNGYGALSGKKLEDLRAGARVDVDEGKRDPLDFVLWKSAKANEPAWDSPWGKGRPGWHIECSAMSTAHLGNHFDIHGGGMDLQFPHHENEIAQSEGCTGEPFVNIWMHNGFVRINEEKMSKSLGNFFTVREVLARYQPEVVRYFILSSHYRSPLNYSDQQLDTAKQALKRLYTAVRGLPAVPLATPSHDFIARFVEVMDDDFNTPKALALLFEMANEINSLRNEQGDWERAAELSAGMRHVGAVLGLLQEDADSFIQNSGSDSNTALDTTAIEALIAARQSARHNKNFAESDSIRDHLKSQGIVLEDGPKGTLWRRV
jgi:cysteinyl-tRNA synthetase